MSHIIKRKIISLPTEGKFCLYEASFAYKRQVLPMKYFSKVCEMHPTHHRPVNCCFSCYIYSSVQHTVKAVVMDLEEYFAHAVLQEHIGR